jgi:ABC-type bacteriocin/lantibiotic exporter with double-glycine peptidase domain
MSTLEVSDLHFRHDKLSRWILEDLSLRLSGGETALLIGDNGSGKSTLGKLIVGLNQAERGSVQIDHVDVGMISVPQRPRTYYLHGADELPAVLPFFDQG